MARKRGFMQKSAQIRKEQARRAKEAERKHKAYLKAQAAQEAAEEKERARLYTEARIEEVENENEALKDQIEELQQLLLAALTSDDDSDDADELQDEGQLPQSDAEDQEPQLADYLPEEPSGLRKLIPGAMSAYQKRVEEAQRRYQEDYAEYKSEENKRRRQEKAHAIYEHELTALKEETEDQHKEGNQVRPNLRAGVSKAICDYLVLVLTSSIYPEGFPQHAKLGYMPESKQLVVEYDLPGIEIVPEVSTYKYVKVRDEITTTAMPQTHRKALYNSLVAQIALRTIHEVLEADWLEAIDSVVFNGYVDTIDKGTGKAIRPCLVTVRTTRETFLDLDLSLVDPIQCLKVLNASVSKSPSELVPVRPVLELNMVDPRFIEETDVLSTLDSRPNLMELTPSEFESLITNLFEKMGLETRLTQASRDGGVDCVAYDPRPIFGGKVVIQAKRYKNTVGVSAVRDLYGTVQNEGASKGILVTTSGYGKAAFDFAAGKPLELLGGSNLLFLLSEHANMEAKIEPPENWTDPGFDTASGNE